MDETNVEQLQKTGMKIRDLIKGGSYPKQLQEEILEKYQALSKQYNMKECDVAVRSSSTAEDLPEASFAGQ